MQLTPYLFFKDNAAEAFAFYAKCLNGKIDMQITMGEMPDAPVADANKNKIAHIHLTAGDASLMGSDDCRDDQPYEGIKGNAISVSVDDPAEAERLFAALSAGADITMPMAETSWSRRFGMLTDRYGANWMVNCAQPQAGNKP